MYYIHALNITCVLAGEKLAIASAVSRPTRQNKYSKYLCEFWRSTSRLLIPVQYSYPAGTRICILNKINWPFKLDLSGRNLSVGNQRLTPLSLSPSLSLSPFSDVVISCLRGFLKKLSAIIPSYPLLLCSLSLSFFSTDIIRVKPAGKCWVEV